MFRMGFRPDVQAIPASNAVVPISLIGGNLLFNIIANASFKLSATSSTLLTLTGLLRFVPLRVAYPVTAGLAVIGVQVAASRMLFHEPISPAQWLGTLLILAGIVLVGGR
jgi:multidrug transporter EmrE-like cation transporter